VKKTQGKNSQERGYSFEKVFGDVLGLEPTRGSGNQWFAKMDLNGAAILVSCKHTDAESFRVTKGHLREIQRACTGEQEPALAIDVDGEVFIVQRAGDWIASRTSDAAQFIEPSKADAKRARSKVPVLLRGDDDGS
jgi:hypothetical protein